MTVANAFSDFEKFSKFLASLPEIRAKKTLPKSGGQFSDPTNTITFNVDLHAAPPCDAKRSRASLATAR